jgi:hypothetical protein
MAAAGGRVRRCAKASEQLKDVTELKMPTQSLTVEPLSRTQKALKTARWARIMTKWLITNSNKGGVKWRLVEFNGRKGQESYGIVDMIAVRKKHSRSTTAEWRGDLFEIILVQVKGGSARFPTDSDVERMRMVKEHHRADRAVLVEWKKGQRLACYEMPDLVKRVSAESIFGKVAKKTSPPQLSADGQA